MTIQNTKKPNRKARRETVRLLALCALLCVPLLFITPISDAGYRAACYFVPSLQNRLDSELSTASGNGDLATVKRSLRRGANIEALPHLGFSPLLNAILGNCPDGDCPDTALYLVQQGAGVNNAPLLPGQKSVLLYSVLTGQSPELIKEMLQHGAKVDWQDSDGVSVLMTAASSDNAPIVKLLLQHGANPNLRDNKGKTALDYARREKKTAVMRVLEDAMRTQKAKPRA